VNWTRGNHGLTFGGEWTQISLFQSAPSGGIISNVGFGIDTGDKPGNNLFGLHAWDNTSDAQFFQAQGIYALLTGRITSVSGTAVLDENTNNTRIWAITLNVTVSVSSVGLGRTPGDTVQI